MTTTNNNKILKKRTLKDYVLLWSKGFLMGASDVVPGVSGGTMAFILKIYDELIHALKSFDTAFMNHLFSFDLKKAAQHISLPFLIAVGLGIVSAIFTLAKGLAWLLENEPVLIWSFFFGLIIASVITVSKDIRKWNLTVIFFIAIGALFSYILVGLVPKETPNTYPFLMLSGAVAICAMILPGISGSFILVILGKYHTILSAVNNKDFITLVVVGIGAAGGLLVFVRILNRLLSRYRESTIALLMGLMIGSLRKIWPWKFTGGGTETNILPNTVGMELISAAGLMLFGFIIVMVIEHLFGQDAKGIDKK